MPTVGLSFYGVEYSPVATNQTRAMVSLVRQVYGPYNAFSCKNDRAKRLCRCRAKKYLVSMFGSSACDRRMRRVETRDPEYTGSVDELNALRVDDAILEAA